VTSFAEKDGFMPKKLLITSESPPNAFALSALAVDDSCSEVWHVDAGAFDAFVAASGDRAPLHFDDDHARRMGFPSRIAHGALTTLRFSRLLGMYLPGTLSIICNLSFDYRRPVTIGDTLRYSATIEHVRMSTKVIRLALEVCREDEVCATGTGTCLLKAQ
jgi:3-hydroxybutyryl-CoA dehydratase